MSDDVAPNVDPDTGLSAADEKALEDYKSGATESVAANDTLTPDQAILEIRQMVDDTNVHYIVKGAVAVDVSVHRKIMEGIDRPIADMKVFEEIGLAGWHHRVAVWITNSPVDQCLFSFLDSRYGTKGE